MRGLDPHDATVTGMGWATSLGFGVEASWQALRAGRRGFKVVEAPEAPEGTRWAAPIERPWLRAPVPEDQESQAKFLNVSGELAATVVHEALTGAGLLDGRVAPERRGLYVAQTDFSRAQCVDFRPAVLDATQQLTQPLDAQALNAASLHKVNPFVLLETLNNNAFSFLCAVYGLKGANTSFAGFEGPGMVAVQTAARAVRSRRLEAAVALGAAAVSSGVMRHELAHLGLSARGTTGDPGVRPLDRHRAGLAPGDGAGALVFEPLAAARARGPGPYGVVLGQASATGVPPDGALCADVETLTHVARQALLEAGVRVHELAGIVLPASGRRAEDGLLLEAVRDLLGAQVVPITAVAGALGHLAAALDVSSVLVAALALRDGMLPPLAGYGTPEPGFESLSISTGGPLGSGAAVLVLSTGIDGQAHALALARVR